MWYPHAHGFLVCSLVLLLCSFVASGSEKHAPRSPNKLVSAKRLHLSKTTLANRALAMRCLCNFRSGAAGITIADRAQADVVIMLDHKDGLHNFFYLRVVDRETSEPLWTAKKDAADQGMGLSG